MVERWNDDDDDLDFDEYLVAEVPKVDETVHVVRVLLGWADPDGLTEFDRVHDEGWMNSPPHWSGDLLREFSAATGRVPDPGKPQAGAWRLTDERLEELAPKLPWTGLHLDSGPEFRRESTLTEWNNAWNLHLFLADAVAAGNDVIAD